MTKTAMMNERKAIWQEYAAHRGVYETKMVEVTRGYGFGEFEGTGEFRRKTLWVRDMSMEEWNAEKAKRYNFLNAELAEYEAEKARKAKVRRYEKELEELKTRMEYLEKWLAENK